VFLNFSGTSLVVCTDDIFNAVVSDRKFFADYIVITKAVRPDVEKLLKHFKTRAIIIDSSVGYYDSVKWMALCRENKIECWPVRERGAFMMDLK